MSNVHRSTFALVLLLAAAGCTEPRRTPGEGLGTASFAGGAADGSDVTVDVAQCVRCHGDAARVRAVGDASGIQIAPPVDVSRNLTGAKIGAHQAHLAAGGLRATGVPCASCHVTPANPAEHVPGVGLRGLAATAWAGAPAISPAYAGGSCSNTYCHGAFPGGLARTVSWTGGAADAACGTCHGRPGAPHPATGTCGACHPGYTETTVNADTHIDGEITGGCNGCHGTTGRPDGGIAGVTYDPNQGAAPPLDTSGSGTGVLVGAHLAHVNPTPSVAGGAEPTGGVLAPIACTECHPDNTTGTHPDNAQATVTFALATHADLDGYAPTRTLGNGSSTPTTCSTYCHQGVGGGSVGTWAWNGLPADCGSCHGFPPASHGAMTASTECAGCHGDTVAADGTIDVAGGFHIDGTVQASGCTGCHGTDARPNGDMAFAYDANQNAAPPVDTTGASTGVLVGAHLAHVNPTNASGVYKPIACVECHPNNTSGGHPDNAQAEVTFALATAADLAGFSPAATLGNGTSTPTTCTTYCHNGATGASAAAWSWNGAAATCASCHGDPPATGGHAGLDATSDCGGCHPGYSATTVNLDTHINGQLDGGESIGGLACRDCHASIFTAMSTAGAASRHALALDGPADTALSWTGTLSSNLAASRSCVNMCHGDHPHDLTSPLVTTHEYNAYLDASTPTTRGGATRTSLTRSKTDFVLGEAKGGLCTSCHLNPIASGRPTVTVASYGATAHDFTAASGSTWRYALHAGAFDRNCTKCHASAAEGTTPTATANSSGTTSVHFNANDQLLAGRVRPAGSFTGFVCFNCHANAATPLDGAQGNRSGKDLQTPLAKTYAHPVVSDAVHDSVAELSAAYNDGTFKGTNRHVNCLDCHDSHRAGRTLHTKGTNAIATTSPLYGAIGVPYTPPATNWTPTTDDNFADPPEVPVAQAAAYEYEICFKCHSSFAYGTTPPTGQTDVAMEFSTSNASYHPVVGALPATDATPGSSRLVAAQLVGTDRTWTPGQTMTCSDCHNADAASPAAQGPHGSAIRYMLAGTNKAWPYTQASQNGGSTGTLFSVSNAGTNLGTSNGLFCRNCHPAPTAAGSNSIHRDYGEDGDHNGYFDCVDCHIRIPHGGKVSRLIVTPNAPARYKGSTTVSLDFFRKNANKDNYGSSDFNTTCSRHSSATPTEAW